jgi:phage regulator Rha-like protein
MKKTKLLSDERILNQIYLIRGQKVMIDSDLAVLYGVETKRLKEAVRRNMSRFPEDFMFQLTKEELENQRTQIASFNLLKYNPFCFSEQGVTMLACILNSEVAIEMNIRIIRLFSKMREALINQKEILARLELIERNIGDHDENLVQLFEAIHLLLSREEMRVTTGSIGFNKPRE